MSDPTQQGVLIALADAVAATLAAQPAGTFVAAFTPSRRFCIVRDLADIKAGDPPLVDVIPGSDQEERSGGGSAPSFIGEYEVDVVIHARVGVGDAAEEACATLMLLRQQIRDLFKGLRLTVQGPKVGMAVLTGIDGSPAFSQQRLIETHCFVSAQTLQFRLMV